MIRLRDSMTLALTKLRTRKVRLTVTIVISGLLFSLLMGASVIFRGSVDSIRSFNEEGFGSRYILQASPNYSNDPFTNKDLLSKAATLQKDVIARKKVEAKRLGIVYEAETEPPVIVEQPGPTGDTQKAVDPNHPLARRLIAEFNKQNPTPGIEKLRESAEPFGLKTTFEGRNIPFAGDGSEIKVLKNGEESFVQTSQTQGPPTGLDSFTNSWSLLSKELLVPFAFSEQDLEIGADKATPIIVPVSAAEQLLKLDPLTITASKEDRLTRMKQVRESAKSLRFSICYRNATSNNLISQAISTQQNIHANANKKDFVKPDLIYGLPKKACGAAVITRDVRTAFQKQQDAKQVQFNRLFGEEAPRQQTLEFRVAGLAPDPDYGGSAFSVGQIVRSLLTSSLGTGWYSSLDQKNNPFITELFDNSRASYSLPPVYFVELTSVAGARSFIEQKQCEPIYNFENPGSSGTDICEAEGKHFMLNPYGSNSLALEAAQKGFGKVFRIAVLVIAGVASIIMMGTVGRMIADSRRETAVFRAIGAKKLDIAFVYILYVIMLSLLISIFAISIGLIFGLSAQSRWGDEVTVQALVAYNSQDLSKTFKLYTLYPMDTLLLVATAVAAGLVSSVFPLLRNLRRNPIRDMRDEN